MAGNDKLSDTQLESAITFDGESQFVHNENSPKNVALMWQNLTYITYHTQSRSYLKNKSKVILQQLNGFVNFGTMTALMGASGAGKTTLLRCVNGMNTSGLTCDSLLSMSASKHISKCFIVQNINEHLLMSLTVRQSLRYASLLKNRGKSKLTEENAGNLNVENLVEELMLDKCVDTRVSECSGGEQKRLVIAMELTAQIKPNLICIDEPTSGLDSNSANKTVCCLQTIARKHNIAIVTSIHQPNSDVLMMFDMLYVLSICGECVYFGAPIGVRNHLIECQIQCSEYQTPIEVLLKVSSKFHSSEVNETVIDDCKCSTTEELSRLISKTKESMNSLNFDHLENMISIENGFNDNNRAFNVKDLWYLLNRNAIYSWIAQWKINAFLFAVLLFFALLWFFAFTEDIGKYSSCLELTNNTMTGCYEIYLLNNRRITLLEENFSLLFCICVASTYVYLSVSVLIFPAEIKVFFSEHRNGWYSTGSYYWAKSVIELPLTFIMVYIYCWIVYYSTSQPDMNHWYNAFYSIHERFSLFVLVLVLFVLDIQGFSMFFSVVFIESEQQLIYLFAVIVYFIMFIINPIFIPISTYSPLFQNISNFSLIKLCLHSFLIILYGRNRCQSNQSSTALTIFNVNENDFWFNIYCFLAHLIFWRITSLLILILKANPDILSKIKFNRNSRKRQK